MSNLSYGSGLNKKQYTCVEIASLYTQTGAFIPTGPLSIQGIYTNTIGDTINATISVSAGGSITPAGFNFNLGGGSTNYVVTVTFGRKFSGQITLPTTSMDNSVIGGIDKFCNSSIGNPDIFPTDAEVVGNCLQAVLGSNPAVLKTWGWSEVDELTTFTFQFQRTNIGSTVTMALVLTEKVKTQWEKNDSTNPVTFTDPLTNTSYSTLPAGVEEVLCQEDQRVVSYTKELCYKIGSQISFDYSGNPAEPWDAYNGIRPRQDGIPFLPFTIGGTTFNEFSPDGKYLYSVSGAFLITHSYNGFTQTGASSTPINFTGAPTLAAMAAVGIAVHPSTGLIYVTYIDGTRRLWLATLTSGGLLQLVGDTQFTTVVTALHDSHDITFTLSGQLVLCHGSNMYLVDHQTGVINTGVPIVLEGASTNTFAIRNISRYYNGDLHLSGSDTGLGPIVLIYNGETYTKVRHWASNNSTTPPDSVYSTAYPLNPEVKFNRLYIKNVETNKHSIDDRDIVTGNPITLPNNPDIKDCSSNVSKEVSWTEDLCYVIDKNVLSQGTIEIVAGQIVSTGACAAVGGFVAPAPLTYSSITHDNSGLNLYALNAGGTLLDTYNWATINAPVLSTSLGFTGLVSVAENEKSLRTRWSDNTLWLMTEEVVATNRFYRFYIVNKTTAALSLQGTVTYPAGGFNNGHMTWGVDDSIYFSYNIGLGTYRISKLSKVSYNIDTFVADVSYVVDNINTDLPNQRLILSKSGVAGVDYLSYSGKIVQTCGASIYADTLHAPFGIFQVGDTVNRIKKVFIKDLLTGDVTSYYHDYLTGEDITLPNLARIVNCDTSVTVATGTIPRFRVLTGVSSWDRLSQAPEAKSITLIRVAGTVTVNDGISGPQAIAAAATLTWTAPKFSGNLTFTGIAGTTYYVSWA